MKAKAITRISYKLPPEKGDKGERGAIRRLSEWQAGVDYLSGAEGEAYQDMVVYNGVHYLCNQSHRSVSNVTPLVIVNSGSTIWTVASEYKFVCTKGLFVGTGSQGWIADEGRIYHTSGLIELDAAGTIKTSNGAFSVDKKGNLIATSGTFSGFLKIPFKSFEEGATYLGDGVYRVSTNFNLYSQGNMSGYAIELQLPSDASFSGSLLTIFDFPVKTRSSPTLTISCQSGACIYHPSKKGTYGLEAASSIECIRGGLIQLLAVNVSGSYSNWMVVTDIMPDAVIS